jgi:hypothetical protein
MRTRRAEREKEDRDKLRDRAKEITAKRQKNYIEGRIGLIIDGTGHDFDKISSQSIKLRQIGYDTHMIFVNTSLDTALVRNAERERSVHDSIAIKSWNSVQANIGKFSSHFRQNFIVVDNNDATEDVMTPVFKQIRSLLKKKVNSPRARAWIEMEMERRGITKKPKGW